MPNGPISNDEFEGLFGVLRGWPVIGLAVSGGADSLAMLYLYARWLATIASPPATLVLTVDHGLRESSKAEAETVSRHAAALGLAHETLVWTGPKPATGISQAARDARYGLMCSRLEREPGYPRALVTAHTQDDQAETLMMRLARGSGLDGLAGMRAARALSHSGQITLIRPLLDVPKSRLEATLRALGQRWIEDPTNGDPAYERPRLRALSGLREAAGLTNAALGRSAHRLARANEALHLATRALDATAVTHIPGLSASISRSTLEAAPLELRIRLLDSLLKRLGGAHRPPQLNEVERLTETLASTVTLGGCIVDAGRDRITIVREPGRHGLPELELQPGQSASWDCRFHVALSASAPGPCLVRALDPETWAALRDQHDTAALPARAAVTMPSFWAGGLLVAVPSLTAIGQPGARDRHTACTSHPRLAQRDMQDRYAPFCAASALPHYNFA